MDNVYVRSAEIIRRVKLEMPVHITLNDPFTGDPITCSRANILELLVVESHNLILEGQTVAALYAEMCRFKAASEYAQAQAASAFRKWKARMAYECDENTPEKKTAGGKPSAKQGPTTAEVENYYRTHDDYDKFHDEEHRMKAITTIFIGLVRAFDIKDNVVTDQLKTIRGYEGVMRNEETTDRFEAYTREVMESATPEVQASIAEFDKELSGTGKSKNTRTARSLD